MTKYKSLEINSYKLNYCYESEIREIVTDLFTQASSSRI